MKKLSIEQKAKSYDEAIKVARSKIKNNKDHVLYEEDITDIFPELKESEDERIRKWCISHFRECFRVTKDNAEYQEYLNNKVIPWLEKQGEQKPAEWREEDDYNVQCLIAKVVSDIQRGNVGRNNELIDWLKSIRLQNQWKPSAELMNNLSRAANGASYHTDLLLQLYIQLKQL